MLKAVCGAMRETENSVWVLEYPWTLDGRRGNKPPTERRRMKQGNIDNYHDTWEDARRRQ